MSMEIASYILSGIAAVSLICIIVIDIYTKISWNCPNCDQYNGFLRDGSYNKIIPAQHDSRLNGLVLTKKQEPSKKTNGFCTTCNLNQELKVQQLAAFTSRDCNRYDEEVDLFKQHLEQAYKLCLVCEVVLDRTLQKQKTWLLGLKFSQLRDGINLKKGVLVGSRLGHFTNLTSRLLMVTLSTTLFAAACLRFVKVTGNSSHKHFVSMLTGIPPTELDFMDITPSLINRANEVAAKGIYLSAGGFVVQLLLCKCDGWKKADLLCTILWLVRCGCCWLDSESLSDVKPEWHAFIIVYVCSYLATLLSCSAGMVVHIPGLRSAMKQGDKLRGQHSKLYNPPQDTDGFDSDSELPLQAFTTPVRTSTAPSKRRFDKPEPIPSRAERSNKTKSKHGVLNASVSSSQSDASAELNGIFADVSAKPVAAAAKSSKFSPLRSASDISHMLSEAVGNVSLPATEEGGDGGRRVREQSVGIDRGIGNLNLGNVKKVSNAKPGPTAHHYADLFKQTLSDGVRRRPLLSPSRLDLPPAPFHRPPWDGGPLSETSCMFAPLSRSSSQSSGFASQSSQPDNTATSQLDFRSGSVDGGDDADNQPQNPFYSTRSPRITPPQYAKLSKPSESRYANYNVDTTRFWKSPMNLYSQHGHMGFHKNSTYLNDTSFCEKNLFSKGARDDDNLSVYSQGFDYGYRGRPSPNVYAPQPVYLTPSLFMNGGSPYAMQFCFPQARSAALWDAATYAMPRAQLALMSPESPPRESSEPPPRKDETRSPSRMSSCAPDGDVSTRFVHSLHQRFITAILVCGVLVNVVIYVGNSSWGCQYVDRMLSLLRW